MVGSQPSATQQHLISPSRGTQRLGWRERGAGVGGCRGEKGWGCFGGAPAEAGEGGGWWGRGRLGLGERAGNQAWRRGGGGLEGGHKTQPLNQSIENCPSAE